MSAAVVLGCACGDQGICVWCQIQKWRERARAAEDALREIALRPCSQRLLNAPDCRQTPRTAQWSWCPSCVAQSVLLAARP